MGKRNNINKTLLILVFILALAVVYFAFFKKQNMGAEKNTASPTTQKVMKPVNWENLIPAIRTTIGQTFLGEKIEEFGALEIFEKADITGDGVFEALVDLGSGGAHTSSLTLLRIENGKPTIAKFKRQDGKITSLLFLDGASVMSGENTILLPDKKAIYAGHWERDEFGSLASCSVEAYQWNSKTKVFEFSANLGNEIKSEFCQKVRQGLNNG